MDLIRIFIIIIIIFIIITIIIIYGQNTGIIA